MDDNTDTDDTDDTDARYSSRLHLLWAVVVFQFKLALDGLRDVVMAPISVVAALFGLLFGGNDPGQYYRKVLRFGRRTEIWLNLFDHPRKSGTSDELIEPIRERVMEQAGQSPWVNEIGSELNRSLDQVGEALARQRKNNDLSDD